MTTVAFALKRINVLSDGSKTYDALVCTDDGQVELEFPSESEVDQLLDLLPAAGFAIRDDVTRWH